MNDGTIKLKKMVKFERMFGFIWVFSCCRFFCVDSNGFILKNKPVVGSCGGLANIEEGAYVKFVDAPPRGIV